MFPFFLLEIPQYNQMYDSKLEEITELDKLVLDFDPETKEELISVDKKLVKKLKPHQGQGVKFMWDASFESLEKLNENHGGGCILAHCMGLGRSLLHTALKLYANFSQLTRSHFPIPLDCV